MDGRSVTVRQATSSDFPALEQLLQDYFREGSVRFTDSAARLHDLLAQPHPGFLLAIADSDPVGCVFLKTLPHLEHACECKRLYVSPTARSQGIAAALMDAAERTAAELNCRWMYLDSKDNFDVAVAMYRRRGYQACQRYNDNPEATLFFRKELSPCLPNP